MDSLSPVFVGSAFCGSALSGPALSGPALSGPAFAGSVPVGATGAAAGWFSRSNQLGATVPAARVVGAGDWSRFPHARGETAAAPDCGTVGGAAMGVCSVGVQAGR